MSMCHVVRMNLIAHAKRACPYPCPCPSPSPAFPSARHKCVQNIDNALSAGDYHTLMDITEFTDFEALLCNEVESTYEQCANSADSDLTKPGIEVKLLTKHAQLIDDLEKESKDDPDHVCCSCECLYQRKNVTRVKLSDNLSEDMWPTLKQ